MRRTIAFAFVVTTPSIAAAQARLESVRWLTACWEAASSTRRIVERWKAAEGGEMKGDSRTITLATQREAEGERLRIYVKGDTLVYDAHPSGQARTEFRTPSVAGDSVVFTNPAHDFPQRIIYKKVGADSLIARIEGDRAGRRQPTTFSYKRIDCGGVADNPADAVEVTLRANYGDLATRMTASAGGMTDWFAKHIAADFGYVYWATAGYRPPIVTKEQIDAAAARQAQAAQTATAPAAPSDRKVTIEVERVLVRADTAEVFGLVSITGTFVDTPGRYGPANDRHARIIEQRRLDRWTRRDGRWMLTTAQLIGEDVQVDGKLIQRNGKAITP